MSLSLIAAVPFQVGTDFQWAGSLSVAACFPRLLEHVSLGGVRFRVAGDSLRCDIPLTHYRPFNEFSLGRPVCAGRRPGKRLESNPGRVRCSRQNGGDGASNILRRPQRLQVLYFRPNWNVILLPSFSKIWNT